jgi:hypothetical protein
VLCCAVLCCAVLWYVVMVSNEQLMCADETSTCAAQNMLQTSRREVCKPQPPLRCHTSKGSFPAPHNC